MERIVQEIKKEIEVKEKELRRLKHALRSLGVEEDKVELEVTSITPIGRKRSVRGRGRGLEWTDEDWEKAQQMRNDGSTSADIARVLGRTEKAVLARFNRKLGGMGGRWRNKKPKLKSPVPKRKRRRNKGWTKDEEDFLRLSLIQGRSYNVIAKELRRSVIAVRARASLLRNMKEKVKQDEGKKSFFRGR